MRLRAATAAVTLVAGAVIALVVAGLAGAARSGDDDPVGTRWEKAKTHVVLTMGTSDYAAGDVRVSFLVVRSDGKLIEAPSARLSIAKDMKEKAFGTGTAKLLPIAPAGGKVDDGEPAHIFVGHVRVPGPGTYWLLAELPGGKVSGLGNVIVRKQTEAPGVGAVAPASKTPTLATVKDVAKLTTRTPPDTELLRISVADALKAKVPFVVAFATPKYCSSRTCGPVVDVVDAVRKRWAGSPVRFIHVEIYTDNNPTKGPNAWVREWKLPSEPWTFLVGSDGKVKARFEGAVAETELAAAVAKTLGVREP